MIPWASCKKDFDTDGGDFRDVYAFKTTIYDWQVLFDYLRGTYLLNFSKDGEPQIFPTTIDEVFDLRQQSAPSLNLRVGRILVQCFFITPQEIEFDIDAREIECQSDLDVLLGFMQEIGNVLHKPTVLTPENCPEYQIITYDPQVRQFEYHKVSVRIPNG
jgi:hypothetical protein